jgi:two-component system, LytTR family, response regulator
VAEIRALIVDDEPLARRGIRQLLAPHSDIVVVGECRDGREAVRALTTLQPDLVFLDVEMPGLDGLGVIRVHGAKRMPLTVFITAHEEFAVRAFETRALDYLVKPLAEARFRATIQRVRERMRVDDAVALATRLSALLTSEGGGPHETPPAEDHRAAAGADGGHPIPVPTATGERMLDPADIDWIGADDDHAAIHAGKGRYRVRGSLTALEAKLDPARFVRVHRTAIVRLDQVREWKTRSGQALLVLRDGTELPVSRRRLATVRRLLHVRGR